MFSFHILSAAIILLSTSFSVGEGSSCESGWFGPDCQYEEAGFTVNDESFSWLTDKIDSTCNDMDTWTVTLKLDTPQRLTLLRIVKSDSTDPLKMIQLSYKVDGSEEFSICDNGFSDTGDGKIDFSCPTSEDVTHITLSGKGLKLCSVYIKKGSQCEPGWFGPDCQYSLAEFKFDDDDNCGPFSWLTDKNDKTCSPYKKWTVAVKMETPQLLTWLRIVTSGCLKKIQLSYRHGSEEYFTCGNGHTSIVDDKTLDLSCPTSKAVTHIKLSGDGASLCSLYISGGANVALHQNTSQSSIFGLGKPENAVDGDPGVIDDNPYLNNTCTHTNINQDDAWWEVKFLKPVNINRFLIYNKRTPTKEAKYSCCGDRLKGFTLTAYSEKKSVYSYTDPNKVFFYDTYNVVLDSKTSAPVTRVRFDAKKTDNHNTILSLCEVYIFGESVCEPGFYGVHCENSCKCENDEACFVNTGMCPTGSLYGETELVLNC